MVQSGGAGGPRWGWRPVTTSSSSRWPSVFAPVVTNQQRGLGAPIVDEAADVGGQLTVSYAATPSGSMTGYSRACQVRRPGIPLPRAAGSAAASRTRTRENRAAGRSAAHPRPRRNAVVGRQPRRSPHEDRCPRVLAPAAPLSRLRSRCGRRLYSLPPPWDCVRHTLRISTAARQGNWIISLVGLSAVQGGCSPIACDDRAGERSARNRELRCAAKLAFLG